MNLMINGKNVEVKDPSNGMDVALLLDPENKKKAIAYKLNDKEFDLYAPIKEKGNFELILNDSPEAFHILNHSTSHLMSNQN